MKLGVFSPVLASMNLGEALAYLKSLNVDALELGCGGSPGTAHADVLELDKDVKKQDALKKLFDDNGIMISALSVHGNGVHPNKKHAEHATAELEAAIRVANRLGVTRVVTFSGCPGDGTSENPNWVTCTWPPEYSEVLKYQWDEVLIPYWQKKGKYAQSAGVKVCFEMHPGFCVYNTETMLRIREAAGESICANFDPSHLIWQGIDPYAAILKLKDAVQFFHAKDTMLLKENISVNGVLDTKSYGKERERSWIFRTVGYGDCDFKKMFAALKFVGYDYVISIEHEDSLMTPKEGLEKAVNYLKDTMIRENNSSASWWF